jgi:hypothetical protein
MSKNLKFIWHVSRTGRHEDQDDSIGVFSTLKKATNHVKNRFDLTGFELDISEISSLNPMVSYRKWDNADRCVMSYYFEMWEIDNGWTAKDFGESST